MKKLITRVLNLLYKGTRTLRTVQYNEYSILRTYTYLRLIYCTYYVRRSVAHILVLVQWLKISYIVQSTIIYSSLYKV